MPRRAPKTPQEKKRESYEKDRRNAYGENAKSSRKNIPRRKRAVASANRARASQPFRQPAGDSDSQEALQEAVESKRLKRWRKSPDIPLKDSLKRQERFRRLRAFRKANERSSGQ